MKRYKIIAICIIMLASTMFIGCGDKGIVLKAVEIAELPACTIYESGETPDLTGLKVIAVYSDGTQKALTEKEYTTDCQTYSIRLAP